MPKSEEDDLMEINVDYIHCIKQYRSLVYSYLEYSIKKPNRIRSIKFYYIIKSSISEIYKLSELNKESLINLPFFDVEFLKQMPKLTELTFREPPPKDIPDMEYNKINSIEIYLPKFESFEKTKEYITLYLSYIDICINLVSLTFFEQNKINNSTVFIAQILMRMKSNKLIKIKGFELQLEMWFDFDPIIEKFPKLEKFQINVYKTFPYSDYYREHGDTVLPIFQSENFFISLDYSNLYKLMANYTNRNPDKTFEVVIRDYAFLLYLLHKPKIHAKIDAIFYRKNTFHNNLQFIFKYRHKTSIADWIELQLLNKNYNKVDIIILEEKIDREEDLINEYGAELYETAKNSVIPENRRLTEENLLAELLRLKPEIIKINGNGYQEYVENIVKLDIAKQIIDYPNKICYIKDKDNNKYMLFHLNTYLSLTN